MFHPEVTREDIITCAERTGVPKDAITEDFLAQVEMNLKVEMTIREWGLVFTPDLVFRSINFALKS